MQDKFWQFKRAKDLVAGDTVLSNKDGDIVESIISKITHFTTANNDSKKEKKPNFYRLNVETDDTYFANSIIIHNEDDSKYDECGDDDDAPGDNHDQDCNPFCPCEPKGIMVDCLGVNGDCFNDDACCPNGYATCDDPSSCNSKVTIFNSSMCLIANIFKMFKWAYDWNNAGGPHEPGTPPNRPDGIGGLPPPTLREIYTSKFCQKAIQPVLDQIGCSCTCRQILSFAETAADGGLCYLMDLPADPYIYEDDIRDIEYECKGLWPDPEDWAGYSECVQTSFRYRYLPNMPFNAQWNKKNFFDIAGDGCCVKEDTLIDTPEGAKLVKNLVPGDQVFAYKIPGLPDSSEKNKYKEWFATSLKGNKTVATVMSNKFSTWKDWYEITTENGSVLTVTYEHHILVKTDGIPVIGH